MDEGARLEIACAGRTGTEGSNPSLSAILPFPLKRRDQQTQPRQGLGVPGKGSRTAEDLVTPSGPKGSSGNRRLWVSGFPCKGVVASYALTFFELVASRGT